MMMKVYRIATISTRPLYANRPDLNGQLNAFRMKMNEDVLKCPIECLGTGTKMYFFLPFEHSF